jgi:peroxiredoxin
VKQFVELQALLPPNHGRDTQIVAVSPETLQDSRKMGDIVRSRTGREFNGILLSDADHAIIDRYGLLNEEWAANRDYVPHPTTYLLDAAGRVRWKFTEKNFAVRPDNDMILAELKKLWSNR